MLSIMALGLLVAVGSAYEMNDAPMGAPGNDFGGRGDHFGDQDKHFGGHDGRHDFDRGHDYYDWLSPGGSYWYSYWYPSYSYWYPYTYTYNYPVTYYTTPAVYPTYNYYYDPVWYDPWYASNIYGWTGATYYYSGSWSWHRGGFFI